ncbi:MAG: thioredoxin domain-containing protein [bacterium]
MTKQPNHRRPNHLIGEKSPYLLQHAYNPVDWYPWGAGALNRARKENRLIFLSIGYSTCHWCHVMEEESFEDEEVAALLNRDFICIKVDREERPDLDKIYMTAVQALTGGGGWPLNVFLTPDLKPFFGGTYFPPRDKWGRAGMTTLLPKIVKLWKENPQDVVKSGDRLT